MSDPQRPHGLQPTRLPRPWDSPGKNTGVGCHFLLQCMKVKRESEVAQLCPTLSDPMNCSPLGSSIHGIFQARVLEWGAIAFSNVPLLLLLSRFSCVRLCATPEMAALSISNFLEGISRLSPSVAFLYFFALITEEAFLSLFAILWTLHSNGYIFPFHLCLSLCFFSKLFVRPPQTTIMPFLHFFFFFFLFYF